MGPLVENVHKLTYQRNVQLAVQQKTSRFERGFTYQQDLKGRKAQLIELIGATEAIIDGNRGGDTPNIDANLEPVWMVPHQIEWGKLIEKEDAIKALTDYQSPFVQNGAAAIVRGRDGVFASSIFANRLIGEDGTTSQAWDSTNKVVAVDVGKPTGFTTAGMNLRKIQRAKRYFRAQHVMLDQEELWGVLNSQEMEELIEDIVANASIPAAKRAEYDRDLGIVYSVAGVNFVHYEDMADFDVNTTTAAIWCKSGMYYGDFSPLDVRAEPNPAKKYRIHPYMENWWGSSRTEDQKVVKILNAKVPA